MILRHFTSLVIGHNDVLTPINDATTARDIGVKITEMIHQSPRPRLISRSNQMDAIRLAKNVCICQDKSIGLLDYLFDLHSGHK